MGLFSSKKKTTETSNQTTTTTPTVPDWILQPSQGLAGQISDLSKLDPASLVAGTNPLLNQAAAGATNLTSMPWNFDTAATYARQAGDAGPQSVQAASVLDNLGAYKSGYEKEVRDAALADYDFSAGMTRAQDQLARAGDATFGGSGGAIQTALSNDAINRGRGSLSANLNDQAFTRATALSEADASRRQAASLANAQFAEQALGRQMDAGKQLTDLSSQYAANERANTQTQFDLGQFIRSMQQDSLNAPLTMLDTQASLLAKLNPALFAGETSTGTKSGTATTTSSGSLLSKLGQAAQVAGTIAAMSDERLKTNIRRIGTRDDGLPVYEFEYRFAPGQTHVGVMAQEAQAVKPEAVMIHPTGFLMVDYSRLDS